MPNDAIWGSGLFILAMEANILGIFPGSVLRRIGLIAALMASSSAGHAQVGRAPLQQNVTRNELNRPQPWQRFTRDTKVLEKDGKGDRHGWSSPRLEADRSDTTSPTISFTRVIGGSTVGWGVGALASIATADPSLVFLTGAVGSGTGAHLANGGRGIWIADMAASAAVAVLYVFPAMAVCWEGCSTREFLPLGSLIGATQFLVAALVERATS